MKWSRDVTDVTQECDTGCFQSVSVFPIGLYLINVQLYSNNGGSPDIKIMLNGNQISRTLISNTLSDSSATGLLIYYLYVGDRVQVHCGLAFRMYGSDVAHSYFQMTLLYAA